MRLECRLLRSSNRPEPEHLRERRLLGELGKQALHIPLAQRDRASPADAGSGVGETNEPLALLGLEQLDDRGEPSLTRPLLHSHPFYDSGRAPRRGGLRRRGLRVACASCLRHVVEPSEERVTRGKPLCHETVKPARSDVLDGTIPSNEGE